MYRRYSKRARIYVPTRLNNGANLVLHEVTTKEIWYRAIISMIRRHDISALFGVLFFRNLHPHERNLLISIDRVISLSATDSVADPLVAARVRH